MMHQIPPARWRLPIAIAGIRFDLQQCGPGVDLHVGYCHHLPDLSGKLSTDRHLHLHGFQNGKGVSDRNRIAGLHRNGDDNGRCGSVHHATVVPIDGM